MTPPVTPDHSRDVSLSRTQFPRIPSAYAIKEPSGRTAQRVLGDECRILSYLSRFPDAEKYIVPFFGQDMRTEALVLGLMDGTLEDWAQEDLNEPSEDQRTAKLAEVFPRLASQLLNGFIWMTSKNCTHGDIKPGNILITSSSGSAPHAIFTDFSSSTLSTSPDPTKNPIGGATYDYLDPALMTKASAKTLPTPETDLWALAITLLFVVIGASPYTRVASSEVMKRDIIKQGNPLAWMAQGENGMRNMQRMGTLAARLSWDVTGWFKAALAKDASARVGFEEWRDQLERGVGMMGSRI
jgi:serine/threonine protein kinase